MEPCETKESMRHQMRPVTLAMATAAFGTALAWAGIVTSLITGHELATAILFAAAIPCLIASAIFSAIAAVRLRQPSESTGGNSNQRDEGDPRSPQDPEQCPGHQEPQRRRPQADSEVS